MENVTFNVDAKTPAQVAEGITNVVGVKKTNMAGLNLWILGIFAGVYIGFAAAIATLISSDASKFIGVGLTKFMTGSVFSFGLMLVIMAGAELFTGNNLMIMSVLEKKVKMNEVLKKWLIVYIANFVGSVLLAFIIYKTDLWKGKDFLTGVQALKIANAKVNLSFGAAFFRAICCNWLVCLAVWMAVGARTVIGKIFAIYFPIMTFVALGFEHCIANMYFIPMGLFLKGTGAAAASGLDLSNLTVGNFFTVNLLPVTLGNMLGGILFVGAAYWLVYVKKNK